MNKIEYKNKVKIIERDGEKNVVKKKKKDIMDLFNFLESRNFRNYPKIIETRNEENVYEYVDDTVYPKEMKARDLMDTLSELHSKTSYNKEISLEKHENIYDDIKNNILYIENYYKDLIANIDSEKYMSPSGYLIARNFSTITASIEFCKKEIDEWYKLINEATTARVSVIHNNLDMSHYLKRDKGYLISWDDYLYDTPVMELYKFYINNAVDYNFEELFKVYEKNFKLTEDERKLLFVLISIPPKFEIKKSVYENTNNVRIFIDRLYKTANLIRPYYAVDVPDE